MKYITYIFLFQIFACNVNPTVQSISDLVSNGQWVDLRYSFSDETLYWPTADKFRFDTVFAGETSAGFHYEAFNFCAAEHGGTHLDAPVHFAKGKRATDQIPISQLVGDAVIIDVSEKALNDPDYQIMSTDIEDWEKTYGHIPDESILLFKTGYGSFYPDAKKYLGTDERGAAAVAKLHFPGIHPDAATWLVKHRKIKAVGIDVASVDFGQSTLFKTHQVLYKQNIPGFENVSNLDKLPPKGSYVVALPMKIKNGSGGPLRIIAWIKNKN
jgi:kynurenine formamidase